MKIHALCLAKNESDIIDRTLTDATNWCDFIYVFDNGSSDGTWEKVLALSKRYKQIIPYKQENCPFRDSLAGQMFNHYRANSVEGDWWCRLDADDTYIDEPRIFLNKVPKRYQVIVSAFFNYFFTDKDMELYNQDPSLYADDIPVEQKCRYYINNWSEIRFFRYRKDLTWHDDARWPSPLLGDAYPVRIRMRNFQYRSPQQIDKRLEARRGNPSFPHEVQAYWKSPYNVVSDASQQTWKDRVIEASRLYYDAHDGRYVLRNDLMPDIYTMSLIWDYRLTPGNLAKRLVKKVRKYIKHPGNIPISRK
jgi:glycosyltransferase involved in cell wall biosynthesis